MQSIDSDLFTLQIEPVTGSFSLFCKQTQFTNLNEVGIGFSYRLEKKEYHALRGNWQVKTEVRRKVFLPALGDVEVLILDLAADTNGIAGRLEFGIVQEHPLVIWRIEIMNQGKLPVNLDAIHLLRMDPSQGGRVCWPQAQTQSDLGFFSNGWQSWSPTRAYRGDERMLRSRLGSLQLAMTRNPGTPLPGRAGVFSSDFFAVLGDRAARSGFVLGSLSQENHFTSILADFNDGTKLEMWANGDGARLDPGCSMPTDWAVFSPVLLDHRAPLEAYFEAVARQNQVKIPSESPTGWCSWYHFYTKITEPIIRDNLKTIVDQQESLPLQLVQIDDGFESQIGDWFTFVPGFPQGVAPLAAEITKEGLLPGLWLAPFILHPKAEIIRQHPDWVLRKANGRPVNCGYVWGALTTALDLTVPEALEYACSVVRTAAHKWGYPYLKLDFLYAAAVNCRYQDPTLTRAQVLRRGMQAIREAVGPDVTILGCGAPLGSVLGLVEANRIGADVSGSWTPKFAGLTGIFKNEPSMPSARNSIRNILTRAAMHNLWWINDPDCLLVRPDTDLSLAEVQSLAAAIALTGGSLLVSDDLPKLPRERQRIAESLLPVIGERARMVDWFDTGMPSRLRLDLLNDSGEWHVLTTFNWSDAPADLHLTAAVFHLPDGDYWASEFWSGQTCLVKAGESFIMKGVPANGCAVTAWRRVEDDKPLYLGSNLHISQGVETAEWKVNGKKVNLTLRLPRKAQGVIRVWFPGEVQSVLVNGRSAEVRRDPSGVLSIPVEVDGFAGIEIV